MSEAFKSTENLSSNMETNSSQPPQYDDVISAPPNYREAVAVQIPIPSPTPNAPPTTSAAPPSYESLFGNIRAAHEEHGSSNKMVFVKKVVGILMNTIGYSVMLGIMYVVPIAMIIIGSLGINDCPMERQIPIFLIVFGVVLVVKNTLSLVQQVKRYRQNNSEEQTKKHPGEGIIDAFLLIWFVAGNIWVYRQYNDVQYKSPSLEHSYCDNVVYLFAFWVITTVYIFCMAAMTCCCCAFCLAICCNKNNNQSQQHTQQTT
ncbi:transmembrane protein 272-like [Symsagittifera roscoffensis]|uniref:transmembrane protein 272-like n=1 Tax=Symsagittifera roscoffensis TaxID=84072 RepID=UPI00307CAC44